MTEGGLVSLGDGEQELSQFVKNRTKESEHIWHSKNWGQRGQGGGGRGLNVGAVRWFGAEDSVRSKPMQGPGIDARCEEKKLGESPQNQISRKVSRQSRP